MPYKKNRNTTVDEHIDSMVNVMTRLSTLTVIVTVLLFVVLFSFISQTLVSIHESPQKVFSQAFETKVDEVKDLQGFGGWIAGYDCWLTFKKDGKPALLKEQDKFTKQYYEPARLWFLEKFPDSPALRDNRHLSLLFRRRSGETYVINEWLLYNSKTSEHFYRIWGLK